MNNLSGNSNSQFDMQGPLSGFEREGTLYLWSTLRLWDLVKNLSEFEYEIASFNGFDKDVWFGTQQEPTVNNVLDHFKRIEKTDFKYPIILNQDNIVLDGVHRICRAHLEGRKTISAVKFDIDPDPDRIIKKP